LNVWHYTIGLGGNTFDLLFNQNFKAMSNQTQLPAVIETFINAMNSHDSDMFISVFAEDALVNDFARNFWGKDQIKAWADKEIIEPKVTFTADEIVEHYGDFLITALTDGNYDKSKSPDPTYLDYFFTVKNDKIVKMIVTKNKEKSAAV
jgi:ketosteroid isomerase-like protein